MSDDGGDDDGDDGGGGDGSWNKQSSPQCLHVPKIKVLCSASSSCLHSSLQLYDVWKLAPPLGKKGNATGLAKGC